jgi:UDP-N-acetylmuramoyl-tripeptide--D-alanyl-D-alanine ligase
MIRGSIEQVASTIDGAHVTRDAYFQGVSTDSRQLMPGSLFVALRGERFDAHDFLDQIVDQPLAAVVVERLPEHYPLPALVVPDTLAALGRIGNFWRRRFAIPVIGVTGSNGKTTVKEMISAILMAAFGAEGRLATQGNLNNEIGVPLTVTRLTDVHQAAVVELGMNHPGEIARLAAIAEPTVALVNNAQREHQEFMHTVEAVARENGAVLQALPVDGVAVFPGDDEYTALWRELAAERKVMTFGLTDACDVRATYTTNGFGSELAVEAGVERFAVVLAAAGVHNVRNALAAIACALGAGIPVDAIVRGLEAFAPVSGRLQRKQAVCGATVIDDSYNANPTATRTALQVLAGESKASRRVAVLGEMLELGVQATALHEEIGRAAAAAGVDVLVAVGGDLASALARSAVGAGMPASTVRRCETSEDAADVVAALVRPGDVVLVKGSRGIRTDRVVERLIAEQA